MQTFPYMFDYDVVAAETSFLASFSRSLNV